MATEPGSSIRETRAGKSGTLCSVTLRPEFKVKIPISPLLLDDFISNRERKITIGRDKHKFLVENYLKNGGRTNFDLNKGQNTYDPRPQGEGLGQILQYITWKSEQTGEQDLKKVIKEADVVCWRGSITKMAASPYEENGTGWKIAIDKFEDVLFFHDMETDTQIANMEKQTEWEKKCTYWGHKFETYIFAERGKDPTPDEPVSTWEEMGAAFFTIFPGSPEAKEAEVKAFYAAEMDGLDSENRHVEVKTQAHGLWKGQFFQKKAMKWWIQSHIVDINYLIVGIRNNNGIVNRVEKVDLDNITRRCDQWNGNVIKEADVVCWRGMITKMAASPYEENGTGWKFAIEKFQNTFFFHEMDTDAIIQNTEKQNEEDKKYSYWGHKFETYIFAERGKDPTPDEPVSTWEEMKAAFFTVIPGNSETKEAEIKVFYAAEMDGLDSENRHVEVKTQAHKLWKNKYFQKKAMKWWIQSHIVGINYLVVGIRDEKGIVSRLEKVDLEVLRERCNQWNGNVCLRTFQHVVNQVRTRYDQLVKPDEILIIERKPNENTVSFLVVPKNSTEILTPEFRKKFEKSRSSS
ncbi:hypothetical protein FO519_005564 [Halicephalobus sp. NKZ332]|nr:hypothetical protein FO519_005564 [Halicephalobus sp. NKZ332]